MWHMKRFAVAIATLLLRALYAVCRLTGVRNRIVCISRQSDDEPVDFALIRKHLAVNRPDVGVVVLARALDGKLAYCAHMLRQVYHIATCRAVVLDSYCIAVSLLAGHIHAPVVQMWHAMGNMKRFGWMALGGPEGRDEETARLMHMHEGYDSVLISSMSFARDFASGMGITTDVLFEAPLPRTDLFISEKNRSEMREAIHQALPQTTCKKNIVYCPTFRRDADGVSEAAREALAALCGAIDFDKCNLIYKRHPVSTLACDDPRVICDIPDGLDVLFVADWVVSDYSTVIYEAGLLGVPVSLFAYDWDTYSRRRSLFIDIAHDVPALFTDDAHEIARTIEADDFDADAWDEFTARNIALPEEGTCTARVVDHILSLARL